ncbi:nucleotidyltransferase domain-containing protein [cf. Phormidesmis sp. LEGE 11477]|uniref:nucleotidyltransferase domain-containing protein n=1 Tax=cf. Phormidesmis sp. LEGE 11477 TaxID=1828680 RepID=UPI0018811C44|nr:nucleotidyltransferase domain-containing protein [cf. Phormidesmis sp. LEGE 11477]MBE9063551.1 nucleotidyltransferase domain-containing protein [cf. Phormidesmis sp. LEGE 11477]
MQESDRQIAAEFHSRLKEIVSILDLRIFGSRAEGSLKDDSDLDVFIKLANLDRPLREKIHDLAWEVGFEHNRIISTFVVTEAQLQTEAIGASPLLTKVFEEGVAVV